MQSINKIISPSQTASALMGEDTDFLPLISLLLPCKEISDIIPIKKGGSNRSFYRIKTDKNKSYIFQQTVNMEEFRDYIVIGVFLKEKGISVPQILSHKEIQYEENIYGIALIEDCGDDSLYNRLHKSRDERKIIDLYSKVLDELVKIQQIPPSEFPSPLHAKKFDKEHYLWETEYFRKNSLNICFGIETEEDEVLRGEFESLAESLLEEPLFFVHRDFQSQNILIKDEKIYIIDFQSARQGNRYYDVVSLLWDPYINMEEPLQKELTDIYEKKFRSSVLKSGSSPSLPETKGNSLTERESPLSEAVCYGVSSSSRFSSDSDILFRSGCQRLMQALGAYGNLGVNQKKEVFLQYISPALIQLKRLLDCVEGLDKIKKYVYPLSYCL